MIPATPLLVLTVRLYYGQGLKPAPTIKRKERKKKKRERWKEKEPPAPKISKTRNSCGLERLAKQSCVPRGARAKASSPAAPQPPSPFGQPPGGALRGHHEPLPPVPAGCHLLPPGRHPAGTALPLSKCCGVKDRKGKVSQSVPNAPATSQEPPALPEQLEEEERWGGLAVWLLKEPGRGGLWLSSPSSRGEYLVC